VEWLKSVSATDFVNRITAEPGLLDRRELNSDGFAVLHTVAAMGRTDLVRVILERGGAVDMRSGALEEVGDTEDAAPRFDPGYTPVMAAAGYGQLAAVRQLLAAGADPLLVINHGGSALHSASSSGSVQVANVLLAAGSRTGGHAAR
jgi:ankyrin repeat protein